MLVVLIRVNVMACGQCGGAFDTGHMHNHMLNNHKFLENKQNKEICD